MSNLKELGLSQYEEAVYKSLVKLGRADARKISQASGVPPTATYPNLKNLVKKGLAQKLEGDVALYEPLDPKAALNTLLARKKASLDASFEGAIVDLNSLPKAEMPDKEPLSISLGKDTSAEIFASLAERTKKTIYIMGWKFRETKNITLLKRIIRLKHSGKDIRMLTNNPSPSKNWMLHEIMKAGVPMRYFPGENFSIVVRDAEETKITLKNPDIGQRVNVKIEDRDLSKALHEYFLGIWDKAKK